MKEFEKTTIGSEPGAVNQVTQSGEVHKPGVEEFSRRNFLGPTVLATAALAGLTAHAQETQDTREAEKDISATDPGQENKLLLDENPSSNMPPPTDHGDIGPVWYSFDLGAQTGAGGRLDARGELESVAELKGSGRRKHAAHRRQLPRIPLAHRR